ncbi:MAG: YggT family protein [Candidatus Shapirobacteria bacterium]
MTEIINPPVVNEATKSQKIEYVVYFLFGALEILLAFRLILKLTGASLASGFVRLIYSLTGIFILPFNGIFSKGYAQGVETTSVLEPATIVAIFVYMLVAWGIVKLVHISSGERQES